MKIKFSFVLLLVTALFAASCTSEREATAEEGFLRLDINTLTSTITRASVPANYDAKTLSVRILDSNNTVIMSTDDVENDDKFQGNIGLKEGEYTVVASSAGWDGSDSAFDAPYYAGQTKVTITAKTLTRAKLTLTLANVKVTVKFDQNLKLYFKEANCFVSSAMQGVATQKFDWNTTASAYFPVDALQFLLTVKNMSDNEYMMSRVVSDVKARDHYIINYKIADSGSMGGVSVSVDDATQSYTFNIEIPRKSSTSLMTRAANAWTTYADLTSAVVSKTKDFDIANMKMQYRLKTAEEWTDIPATDLTAEAGDVYTYRLRGLQPGKTYVYRLNYEDNEGTTNSNEVDFTTEEETQIENASFENWYQSGGAWYPGAQGVDYWSSSNPGSASMGANVTTSTTEMVHSGTYAAKLATKYVIIKMAAASMFTGKFNGLIGTSGARLDWGVPFTSRPKALKGFLSFIPGAVNRVSSSAPADAAAKGETDACQIFCALLREPMKVGGNAEDGDYKKSTTINWQTDPRVIAYGEITRNTSNEGEWEEFTIPLQYHVTNVRPKYLLIVCSANKWGDYFHGCDSNVLYLDDFSFDYSE